MEWNGNANEELSFVQRPRSGSQHKPPTSTAYAARVSGSRILGEIFGESLCDDYGKTLINLITVFPYEHCEKLIFHIGRLGAR